MKTVELNWFCCHNVDSIDLYGQMDAPFSFFFIFTVSIRLIKTVCKWITRLLCKTYICFQCSREKLIFTFGNKFAKKKRDANETKKSVEKTEKERLNEISKYEIYLNGKYFKVFMRISSFHQSEFGFLWKDKFYAIYFTINFAFIYTIHRLQNMATEIEGEENREMKTKFSQFDSKPKACCTLNRFSHHIIFHLNLTT